MIGHRASTPAVLRPLRSVFVLVLLGAIIGGASAFVAYQLAGIGTEYDASLVLAAEDTDAYGMVPTYAALIPEDGRLMRKVAEAVDTTRQDVSSRLTASPVEQTTVMQLDYRGRTSAEARIALETVQQELAGPTRTGPLSNANFYAVRDIQTEPAATLGPLGVTGVGLLLGGLIGACAGLLMRQVRPRAWTPALLGRAVGGLPVARLRTPEDVEQLLADTAGPHSVALVLGRWPTPLCQALGSTQNQRIVTADPRDAAIPVGLAGARTVSVLVARGTPLWQLRRWVDQLRVNRQQVAAVALAGDGGSFRAASHPDERLTRGEDRKSVV